MINLELLCILPTALVLDFLLGEPPEKWHPVCFMGKLAAEMERFFLRPADTLESFLRGIAACLCTILPCAIFAASLVQVVFYLAGDIGAWLAAVLSLYVCLAPRSLKEHALHVVEPLARQDIHAARMAVSMLVGRKTAMLDAHGVARACIESIAENLVDGVLSTLFWACIGIIVGSYAGIAFFVVLHRSANILDALWGKKNTKYLYFGRCAARLDDVLNFIPARLSLPCIACAAYIIPKLDAKKSLLIGWKYRSAHESPNSAWSEAAFAGALHLKLGGSAIYGDQQIDHPLIGDGTEDAEYQHISAAINLMYYTVWIFTAGALLFTAALGSFL